MHSAPLLFGLLFVATNTNTNRFSDMSSLGERSTIGTSSSSQDEESNRRAPLYITVGPQCAGKTTVLSKILKDGASGGEDVSIDEQKGVYATIPTQFAYSINPIYSKDAMKQRLWLPNNPMIHGTTLKDRCLHPSQYELFLVFQRLCNKISATDFKHALKNCIPAPFAIPTQDQRDELIGCVEETLLRSTTTTTAGASSVFQSSNIDLFVADAIFKGGGLQSAQAQLSQHCSSSNSHHQPVAWGNTNTRPREYITALQCAEYYQRPVHFIVFGEEQHLLLSSSSNNTAATTTRFTLPFVNRAELVQRNLNRFCKTGRYIHVKAIHEAMVRTEDLLQKAKNISLDPDTTTHSASDHTYPLHAALAMLAGYQMCPLTRTVSRINTTKADHTNNNNTATSSIRKRGLHTSEHNQQSRPPAMNTKEGPW